MSLFTKSSRPRRTFVWRRWRQNIKITAAAQQGACETAAKTRSAKLFLRFCLSTTIWSVRSRRPCQDAAYRKGIELMMQNLLSILAGLKVQPMQSLGKCFNPDYHEAVSHVTDETVAEERIVQVVQTGFTMDEEVLRHAKVVVAN